MEQLKTPEAKEVILSPMKGLTLKIPNKLLKKLKKKFIERLVKKGDEISFDEIFGEYSKDTKKDILNYLEDIRFIVIETNPEGLVEITKSTKIELLNKNPFINLDEIAINIRKKPDLKGFIELIGLEDIMKLYNLDFLIHKFEDKKEIIYFVNNLIKNSRVKGYFYKIKK